MAAEAKIVHEKSGWFVYSEDGSKKLGGPYKTKEEADKRLGEIEYFKHQDKGQAKYQSTGLLALDPRAFGLEFAVLGGSGEVKPPFEECDGVAVINVCGPLEQHPHFLWQDYESIRDAAEDAFTSASVKQVALCINSPGGAAAGCFELARALRGMSEQTGKPLGVFVDGMATSAAYGLASAATPGFIHAPPTATVANLAVYEMIIDQTNADAQMGVRFLFIPSTGADLKLTGNPHIQQSEAQLAHTQSQVDVLTDYFYGLVEEMRGVSRDDLRALRGASLYASQAVAKGLVDEISDWEGFLVKLRGQTTKGTQTMGAQAKGNPFEEALSALAEAAKDEDPEVARKAKKMLADHYKAETKAADEKPEDDKAPEKKDEAKAADDAPEKKDDEKARAEAEEKRMSAEAEERKASAQAAAAGRSSNEVALANRVLALEAERATEKESAMRAELLGKRPDFTAEVRAAYAKLPIEALKIVVATAPRIAVTDPRAAAAGAAQPGVQAGRADGALPGLRADEKSLLDRLDRKQGQSAQARMEGSSLVLDMMSPEQAAERMKEMQKQGLIDKARPFSLGDLDRRIAAAK